MTGSIFIIHFRSNLGPLNIFNKRVRMFQTVPDTSSYVKVRHDSIFKQVMSKIPTLPNSQLFVFNFLLNLAGKKNNPSILSGRGARDWNIKFILEMEISNLLFWRCAGLGQKLYHWGQTMNSSGFVFYLSLVLGLLGYPVLRLE